MSAPRTGRFADRSGFLFQESVARIMYPRTIEKVFRRTAQWAASFPRLKFFIVIKKVCARDEKGVRSRA